MARDIVDVLAPVALEGSGMAFAIARGLPIVGTPAGAIPETVEAGAAGPAGQIPRHSLMPHAQ